MAAKGYTTEAKVENYLLQNILPTFSSQIDSWISAVEDFIDKYTGRNFIADTEATARLFDGDGTTVLLPDDCVEVTKVEVGQDEYGGSFSEVDATGSNRYFLEPTNYAVKNLPVSKISLNAQTFSTGKQNNRITAKWGYSATVPDDIEFAATVLVAGICNQSMGGGDMIKQEKIGNYSVSYSGNDEDSLADYKRAMEVLDKYKKLRI